MRFRRRYEVVVQGESGSAVSQLSVISEHRNERDAREAAALERRRLEMIRAEEAASWVIMVMRGDEVIHEERPFGGRREDVPVPPVGPLKITQQEPPAEADAAPEAEEERAPEAEDGPAAAAVADTEEDAGGQTGTIPVVAPEPEVTDQPAAAHEEEAAPQSDDASSPAVAREGGPSAAHEAFAVPEDIVAPEGEDAVPAFLAEPSPASAPAAPAADSGATGQAARPRRDADIPSGPVPDDVIRRFEEAIERERERERQRSERRS